MRACVRACVRACYKYCSVHKDKSCYFCWPLKASNKKGRDSRDQLLFRSHRARLRAEARGEVYQFSVCVCGGGVGLSILPGGSISSVEGGGGE